MFANHLNRSGCPNNTDLICDFQTHLFAYTQACKTGFRCCQQKNYQHTVQTASIGSILGHLL